MMQEDSYICYMVVSVETIKNGKITRCRGNLNNTMKGSTRGFREREREM